MTQPSRQQGRPSQLFEDRDNSAGTQATSLVVGSRETPTDQVTTPRSFQGLPQLAQRSVLQSLIGEINHKTLQA